MNTEQLETKIAKIIMTILPGYWNLQAIPGQDFDSAWADLAVNCKELCSSRAREIVELIEGEKPQPRWLDKPDKEGYWWVKAKPELAPDVVEVGYDWQKRLVFFYTNETQTEHWDTFRQQFPEAKWRYVPVPEGGID